MSKTIIGSILAMLISLGLFISPSNGNEHSKVRDDVALEIMTVEVMIDRLEKMPRDIKDEKREWLRFFNDIEQRFSKIVTYETRDNLKLWKLIGRWVVQDGRHSVSEGVMPISPYAHVPFVHIQRLQPDYQKDKKLIRLMAELNIIREKTFHDLVIKRYNDFVYLFEECDTGDAKIQLQIGQKYHKGNGLWRNNIEAVKWYKRAAAAGNADAIGELGLAYIYGQQYGLEEDEEAGIKLLNEAVVKGSASAAYELGNYHRPSFYNKGDRKKAIEMYQIAVKRGYSKAFPALAEQYVELDNGTEALRWANCGDEPNKNDTTGHRLWEIKRADADSDSRGRCSYIKGEVYALGIGDIEQDLALAKGFFEESHRNLSLDGAWAISAMYREGIGVEADASLAEKWKSNAIKLFPLAFPDPDWHEENIKSFAKKLLQASTR
ncbi:MAG: hypothetical protein GWN67_25405 [Phycisphaerae bacterium]|nr:sel1 repeat family protein [Phycisphaerae bacterium]NIP55468.1 sel1 repeat family protein [Phycisphaerae bacterium]NIS54173.1 sel1 repeat family protein [Phycisphaerae bacterium]NIU11777.1 sel1 repeat family protein [Phycisphaerae bacterium]NIU59600.1 hypothetical protein [Phycisphaerae bacterium]